MLDRPAGPAHAVPPKGGRRASGARAVTPGSESLDLPAILAVLRRRLLPLLASVVLIPVLAAIAIHQVTPLYTASGSLIYEASEYKPHELQSIFEPERTTEAVIGSQAEILRSLHAIERVAQQMNLFAKPEFNPVLKPPSLLRRGMWWVFGKPTPPSHDDERAAVLLAAQAATKVEPVPGSRVLTVSFTSADRNLAATAVNLLMDIYLRDQLAAKYRAADRARDWLEERARALRAEVRAQEDKIAAYRAQQGLVQGMHAGLDAEQVSQLTETLARARSDLAAAEGRLDAARNRAGAGAQAEVAPNVVQARQAQASVQAQLDSLLTRFGPNHPDVVALRRQLEQSERSVQVEASRVVSATDAELRAARERVAALEQDLAAAREQEDRNAAARIPLDAMERDADASRRLLAAVLERLQEIGQQAAMERPDARELSLALPPTVPSWPRATALMAAAAAFGILFGLLLAYVLELADDTMGGSEDVRAAFGLPCFALVPELGRRSLGRMRLDDHVVRKPLSGFAEQIRALRAGLWLGADRPCIVAITAARAAEGKTTVALALARSASLSGERVMLIDCDLRRPALARVMGVSLEPGLAELVEGRATLDQVVRKDPLTGMAYIPAGVASADGLSLFMSEAMARLLHALRAEYGFVLMDAPPLQAMTDTRAIAQIADATLLCIRWRRTSRAVVQNAIDLLEQTSATLAGAVLTRVDVRAHSRAGYPDALPSSGLFRG